MWPKMGKIYFLVYIRLIVEEVSEFVQKSSQTLLLSCEQPIMSFLICGELSTFYQNRALTFRHIFLVCLLPWTWPFLYSAFFLYTLPLGARHLRFTPWLSPFKICLSLFTYHFFPQKRAKWRVGWRKEKQEEEREAGRAGGNETVKEEEKSWKRRTHWFREINCNGKSQEKRTMNP